jgi:predicted ATP-dependent endonuclease of OLD family
MLLTKVTLNGYKRFRNETSMSMDGKLIAIIGPNEAGKSSFLKALQHLNHHDPFTNTGGTRELTRGLALSGKHAVIQATFLLEQQDLDAISNVEGAANLRWFKVSKRVEGNRFLVDGSPRPQRDLGRRKSTLEGLLQAREEIEKSELDPKEQQALLNRIQALVGLLDSEEELLPPEAVTESDAVAKLLLDSELAVGIVSIEKIAADLAELADYEKDTPHNRAVQILFTRRPKFLLFDDDARSLSSEYDLVALGVEIPSALQNLARLAKLELPTLQSALSENDHGQIETLITAANKNLKDVFSTSWSQSNVAVRLRVTDQVLHVLVSERGISYVTIAERSDGLRQYISLMAYVSIQESDQPPILLVDEAETHLHYDAQADLVQMFARQELVPKVIYSTHSLGCLPEDLGAGVRLIEAHDDGTSAIQNWFWESDQPGFSPLLFGMGAKTLAFLSVRFALVTEGPTDIILLPTLFREATLKPYLGFQIVPGLSVVSEADVGLLENGAPRTAYLVDNDEGGKKIRQKLKGAGIPDDRIFSLSDALGPELVLEDLIRKDIYLFAVNEELRRSHGGDYSMKEADIPDSRRPKAVEEWCKGKGIKPPNKRAVAYRVVEEKVDGPIVSPDHKDRLLNLYLKVEIALQGQRKPLS